MPSRMRSDVGDHYAITVIETGDEEMGPPIDIGHGAVLAMAGVWVLRAGNQILVLDTTTNRQAAEVFGRAEVIWGRGTLGIATTLKTKLYEGHPVLQMRTPAFHEKPWGWEKEVPTAAQDLQLKLICVTALHRTSEQYHVRKDEVMVFIDGTREEPWHVKPMERHRVGGWSNNGDGPDDEGEPKMRLYFEASTFHPNDVVRTADDYGRGISQ